MKHLFFLLITSLHLLSLPVLSQQTVGLFLNSDDSYDGYTLFAVRENTYLIDNCGRLIHQWEGETIVGNSVYLLENGNLLRTARIGGVYNGGGSGGRIELVNWDNELLWSFDYSTQEYQQHHDIEPLPNGNILLIAWEGHTQEEAISLGKDPEEVNSFGIWSEQIIEIEPTGSEGGNIVWEWHLWDHLIQDFDSSKPNYGNIAEHPELVNLNFEPNEGMGGASADWIHFNAIDYNAELDQIVVSSRHFSEFWVIDHSTTTEEAAGHTGGSNGKGGDLIYRWGNPQAYQRGDSSSQFLFGQHDVHWIPDGLHGAGNFLMYSNGVGRPEGNYSSIEEVVSPILEDGNYEIEEGMPYLPQGAIWNYTADPANSFFSGVVSGVQRLPNGNTLICEGNSGHLFEVASDGTLVWDYICPVGPNGPVSQGSTAVNANVFRAQRLGHDYAAFEGKDLTPGAPIELNPLPSDCMTLSNYDDHTISAASLHLAVNPVLNQGVILLNETATLWEIEILNLNGKVVYHGKHKEEKISISSNDWLQGIYFIKAMNAENGNLQSIKLINI